MKLVEIYEYPVKGCGGHSLCCAPVGRRGLGRDRRLMLVDEAQQFLSQRTLPALATLTVVWQDDGLRFVASDGRQSPLWQPEEASGRLTTTIWGQQVRLHCGASSLDQWLSEVLNKKVTLVYQAEEDIRPVVGRGGRPGDEVSLADGYPLLLTSQASLADLNGRLAQPVGMARFRPNLVIDGEQPFIEDNWQRLRIGEVVLRVAKPCARCKVITIDQQTGVAGKEPLRTLSTYRQRDNKVYFGVNLIPENSGIVHRQDVVEVLA